MIENLLLCVGAQKSGTTWLHAQLKDHPQIGFSNVKEIHYFNTIHKGSVLLARRKVNRLEKIIKNNRMGLERYFANLSAGKPVNKGLQQLLSPVDDPWYIDQFPKKNRKYCADFTPEYALLPDAGFENIKRVSKNRKVIFIMRDPIDRAKSAMRYFYETQGKTINDIGHEQILKLATSDFIIHMSSYDITIKRLDKHFAQDDVLYLFYEDVMKDKQTGINQVTDFLNIIAIQNSAEQLEKRVNVTSFYDFSEQVDEILKSRLQKTYEFLGSRFKVLPEPWPRAFDRTLEQAV